MNGFTPLCGGAAHFFFNCEYHNTFLKCSRTVRNKRTKRKQSNVEDVQHQEAVVSSTQSDCLLDSSCGWLPQPALSPLATRWHSARHDQRQSCPTEICVEVRRPNAVLSTCTGGFAQCRIWPWQRFTLQLHGWCPSATASLTKHPATTEASKLRRRAWWAAAFRLEVCIATLA